MTPQGVGGLCLYLRVLVKWGAVPQHTVPLVLPYP